MVPYLKKHYTHSKYTTVPALHVIKATKRSHGRYSLDDSYIEKDKKNRRLVCCHNCNTSWFSDIGNLYQNNGGCPTCQELQRDKEWKEKYDLIIETMHNGSKLNKHQNHWLWWNKQKDKQGKLKIDRVKLLQKAYLITI